MKKITLLAGLQPIRGRATRMAGDLGVSVSVVSMWAHGSRRVPLERCFAIERLTKGAVRVKWLRPDITFSRWM